MSDFFARDGGDISVAGERITRDELWTRASRVADELRGARLVALDVAADLRTVVAVVGCIEAGVPFAPIAHDAGPLERDHILSDTKKNAPPGGTACVMYTSGTTGLPKGAVLSGDALAGDLDALADAWGWTADDTLVHGLPLFHVHGLILGVLGALRVGSALIHTGRPDPVGYAAANGSLYFGVPTVWSRIAADRAVAETLRSARLLVSGSAGLPPATADALHALCGHVPVERYGMTETLITIAARHDEPPVVGTVGRPLPGVETRLVDDELHVRSPWMFEGYLGNPDATAAGWTDDEWFRTGDAAAVDDDGRFRIVGRVSVDLIKSGGYRIGAGEVENALLTHPAVREAAVVGLPDDDLGQRIVAFVVGDRAGDPDLAQYVADALSIHKRPREVRWVDALPRNAMGKVLKSVLQGDG
ncbi:MAG: AMP-binding protein [Acidimicrobiales bacterium]|nr:AMP-binding protein [Acidimicrobiales bacterium]